MTHDDIIRFGEQADEAADRKIKMMVWPDSASVWAMRGEYHPDWHEVRDEAFAALVAAHEREACARVCESSITPNIDWWNDACQRCADDIRARGEA